MGFVDGTKPSPAVLLAADANTADAMPRPNPAYAVWMRQDKALLSMLVSSLSDEGDSSVADYIGRAQVIVEELTLAGRVVSLDDQNLFVFRGLRPEFCALTASLAVRGQPVTLQELADFLGAQEFIASRDYGGAPTALAVQRGGGRSGRGDQNRGGGQRAGGGNGGSNRGGGRRQQGGRGRGGRGRGRNSGGNQVQCQICRRTGHEAHVCYNRYNSSPQANLTYQDNSDVGTP
ncbi:PREDICTED: chromatin target of PRMT1 protein-like [Ipomoea nil]|uniref:chromatin target of PRMT1 protein-like n=1 Tax=Ipomoea nil TaxID=35883 RepID=UPI000901FB37|nr:PREDICTED: chromatin target of PRMT1 protein-like [Ipomoea nil]